MVNFFTTLLPKDKNIYDEFYKQLDGSYSDFHFSVIQSWLCIPDEVSYFILSPRLILIKYSDVLIEGSCTYIGVVGELLEEDASNILELMTITQSENIKFVFPDCIFNKLDSSKLKFYTDPGMSDYVYSVSGLSSLEGPDYKRIRRELSLYKRDYGEDIKLEELDNSFKTVSGVVNAHHMWDNTFQFNNDPLRMEGLAISNILQKSSDLKLRIFGIFADATLEAILIVSPSVHNEKKYANLHHFRNSYNREYIADIGMHLLAKRLDTEDFDFINFERDANIAGLRHHKELLKPIRRLQFHQCWLAS